MTPCESYQAFARAYPHLPGLRPPEQCPDEALPVRGKPWGPLLWREAETAALQGGLTLAWMAAFTARIPAGECGCRTHWQALLAAAPPPYGGSAEEMFAWIVARHNDVNRRLGKPELALEAARARALSATQP